jgi:nucleotide-binding universal stress UspA family protein
METMSAACKARHPRARVRALRVEPATEGREAKAQTILAESQRRGVELLVIGHRRVSSFLGYVPPRTLHKNPRRARAAIDDD